MLRILFLRHGETGLNADNRFRGFSDVPLNDSGRADAEGMATRYGPSLDRMYTSDLKRAHETAKIVSAGKVPIHVMPDLRPWDIGEFAGKVKTKGNKAAVRNYAESGEAPPGGETIHDFGNRFRKAIKKISAHHSTVAVVTHASNIHELGKILNNDMDSLDVEPGGVVQVDIRSNGQTSSKILERPNKETGRSLS